MRVSSRFVTALILFVIIPSFAKPVEPSHPFVGTWKLTLNVPGGPCDEIYSIRSDGTIRGISAEELSESEYEISDEPNENGFYRWVDTITKSNGRPDCRGYVSPVGDTTIIYVIFHRSGNMFLLCVEESVDHCVGPFVRQENRGA